MLEKVVSSLLSRYLGEYVEGLESRNLEVNLLGGHLVLENLQLRKDAFTQPHLPVAILHGFLGKLILDIPWKNLGKQPVRIVIEDVFLLAHPTQPADFDPEHVARQALASKKRRLAVAEALAQELEEEATQKTTGGKGYAQRLIDSATSLFEVEVRHVHIRYEDDVSNPGSSFALGATLESFSARTTPGEGPDDLLQRFTSQLRNLSLYWDSALPSLAFSSPAALSKFMRGLIYRDGKAPPLHSYLLQPVCGSVELTVCRGGPTSSLVHPKLLISAVFQQFRVSLRERQWKQLLYFSDYLTFYSRGIKFHTLRPRGVGAPRENPLDWWRFALKGRRTEEAEKRKEWSWSSIKQHRRRRLRYIQLWRKRAALLAQKVKLPEELVASIQKLEESLPFEDALSFRSLARAADKLNINPVHIAPENASAGWLSWAWGSAPAATTPANTTASEVPVNYTATQWHRMYQEANFLGDDADGAAAHSTGDVPAEYEKMRMMLSIEQVALDLLAPIPGGKIGEPGRLMSWQMEGFTTDLTQRPTSLSVSADIKSVGLQDFLTLIASNQTVEMLGASASGEGNTTASFLTLAFDQNPLDGEADVRVCVEALQPLTITCSRDIIDGLQRFFEHGGAATQLKQAAEENWASVRKSAELQLQSALDHHKRLDLQIDILAPRLVIPATFTSATAPTLVLELGRFSFRSALESRRVLPPGGDLEGVAEDDFYDHFELSVNDVHASIVPRNRSDITVRDKSSSLLSDFDILLKMSVCIISQPSLPKLRFRAEFPSFLALVSPTKLGQLVFITASFAKSTPVPVDTTVNTRALDSPNTPGTLSAAKSEEDAKKDASDVRAMQLVSTFYFGDVSLLFHDGESDMLLMSLQDFELKSSKSTHDLEVALQLNTFFIEDKLQPTASPFRYIITSANNTSAGGEHLVSIHYINVLSSVSSFKGVENALNLSLHQLDVTINRETLVQAIQFLKNCAAAAESPAPLNPASAPTLTQNEVLLTASPVLTQAPVPAAAESSRKTIKLKAETSVSRVTLRLLVDGQPFVHSALHESHVKAEVYSNGEYKLSGTVGYVSIEDLSTDTVWREIIRMDSDKILDFWFETIQPANEGDSGKIIITVEMSTIRAVYLTRFTRRVANYFSEFTQMQALLSATANRAKERAAQQAKEITQVIIFDISIANPQIVVPRSSNSLDHMLGCLGDIAVHNQIEATGPGDLLDTIRVSISSLGLFSVVHPPLQDSTSKRPRKSKAAPTRRAVIPDSTIEVSVLRPLSENLKALRPASAVTVTVADVAIGVSEEQAELMFAVLYGNMAEVPVSASSALQQKLNEEIASAKTELIAAAAIVSVPPEELPQSSSWQVQLDLKRVSLELFDGNGFRALPKGSASGVRPASSSVGQFAIESFGLAASSNKDGKMEVRLSVKRVTLIDTRSHSLSAHKSFLAPLGGSQDAGPLLSVTYIKQQDGHQDLGVIMRAPRFLLVPSFFREINATYGRIMESMAALKPIDPLTLQPTPNDTEIEDGSTNALESGTMRSSLEAVGLRIKVEILEPELCLIERPEKADSRVLIMKESFLIEVSLLEGRQHVQVSVSDIQIYKARLGPKAAAPVDILPPFSVWFHYSSIPDQQLSISVEVDPIQLSVAFSDIRLFLQLRDQWASPPAEELALPAPVTTDTKPDIPTEGSTPSAAAIVVSTLEQTAKVQWHSVSIVFLNDMGGAEGIQTPLMTLLFQDFTTVVSNWSSGAEGGMTGAFTLSQLQLHYYNSQLNCFEPMVEPWDFYASMGRPPGAELQLKLGSAETFRLNLTKKFVESVLLSLEQWERDSASAQANEGEAVTLHPFVLRNETGFPLTYWLTGQRNRHRVNTGQEQPLLLDEIEVEQRKRFSMHLAQMINEESEVDPAANEPLLSIQLGSGEFSPIHNLLFHKAAFYLLSELGPRHPDIRLYYHVIYEEGTRVLCFGSDVLIRNQTSHSLQIQVSGETLPLLEMDLLAAGGVVAIPLRYTVDGFLRVRPANSEYDWSIEQMHCCGEMMAEKAPTSLACRPSNSLKGEHSVHWLYAVERRGPISRQYGLALKPGLQAVEIVIQPPFRLENALPCRIGYQIKQSNGSKLTDGELAAGATSEIFKVLSDHRPLLSIQLPGYEWGESKKVGPSNRSVMLLNNGQGESTRIFLQAEISPIGARAATLFVPYWLINQTGTKLFYRQPSKMLTQTAKLVSVESSVVTAASPLFECPGSPEDWESLLSGTGGIFTKPVMYAEREILVRCNPSEWSKEVTLQRAGGVICLNERASNITTTSNSSTPNTACFQYGWSMETAPGIFWRTAAVFIRPYTLLINQSSMPISCRQYLVTSSRVDVPAGRQVTFHIFQWRAGHQMQIRPWQVNEDARHPWSSPFFLEAAASFQLPLGVQKLDKEQIPRLLVKVNAAASGIIVTFWDTANDEPDYLLDNQSKWPLNVGQQTTPERILLSPGDKKPYAWCVPLATKKRLHLSIANTQASFLVALDKLRTYAPLTWQDDEAQTHTLFFEATADGLKKILTIRDVSTPQDSSHPDPEEQHVRLSLENDVALQESSHQLDESKQVGHPQMTIGLELAALEISVVDETPAELLLLTMDEFHMLAVFGEESQSLQLSIRAFQIDNQLLTTPYPLMLYSPPVPKGDPFFQISVLRSTRYTHLRYIPYFAVRFQELNVKVDEDCLLKLLRFSDSLTSWMAARRPANEVAKLFLCPPTYEADASVYEPHSGTALYFELFHINPIRINLSFCTSSGANAGIGAAAPQTVLERSLRAGGFLANIDGAPLRLNGLILEHPMGSQSDLISRIAKHYTIQMMAETYKILGAVDILGSPVSLVSSLGTGVYDFFHEPVEGNVANPREFAAGLARGTESLVKNSVFGIFNSASKISGSISKAATTISLDDEWQRTRARKGRGQLTGVGEGLSSGFRRLGAGIFDGVTGVVSQPIKGLASEGGAGLAKGVGKGISGLLLRPAVGVVDLITDTTEGIKNSASSLIVADRRRAPRFFGPDGALRPAPIRESNLQLLLRTIEDGNYERHFFLAAWPTDGDNFVLLSDQCLFCFPKQAASLKKTWMIELRGKRVHLHPSGSLIKGIRCEEGFYFRYSHERGKCPSREA